MAAKKTAKTGKAKKPAPKFKNLADAYRQCEAGDMLAQKCVIGCLSNFGCEHLASDPRNPYTGGGPKWLRYYRGLEQYLMSLVGEYGETEADAEKELVAELNAAVGYADQVEV